MAWTRHSLVAACIALAFCAALAHGQLNPYEPGPIVTGQVSVSPIGIGAPDHRLAIFYPKLPGGYPVILFWSGFAGVTPGDFYSGVFSKIASHGIIVASVFAPEAPDYEKHPNTTLELIDYLLTDKVSKAIEEDGTPGVYLNTSTQLVLMGHSAGGHVICNYVKKGCAQSAVPKAMVFWDPVDGFRSPCSDDGEVVKFNIPTLIIGSDYFLNLCAPENLGYHRFEAAWNCPRWSVAVKNFGHVDMLDAVARIPGAVVCGGNLLATPAQFDANQHLWAGASIAMTKLSAQNQCEYLKYVENAGDHAPDKAGPVTTSNDVPCLGGVGACPKGSCNDLSKRHPF